MFIGGSVNLRTYSFTIHAKTDKHEMAMALLKRETTFDIQEYAQIARSLLSMDSVVEDSLERKSISPGQRRYCVHQDQSSLSVSLGSGYKNDLACLSLLTT